MADSDKVRLRLPSSIKAGDVVQVRVLVLHPMERVERDPQGRIIQKNYNYVNKVIVTYLGKTILTFDTSQGVAENPFFSFTFKATDPALDDALNARAWADTLPRFAHSPAALDHGRYARFAAFLKAKGLIETTPLVGSYAVDLFAGNQGG